MVLWPDNWGPIPDYGHRVITEQYIGHPGFNQYPKALPQLIEHSLQEEQFAVEKYTKQINVIKDEVIIHNLKRIILDEELHVNILENCLNTYQ